MLSLATIFADTVKLPSMLARFEILKLLAVKLPDTSKLVPVAAPMFGVVNTAPVLTTTLPPVIVVVISSTLTENSVPVKVRPAPAVYVPAPEN